MYLRAPFVVYFIILVGSVVAAFKKIKEYRDGSEMVYYDNCHDVLPADVMEWSGLSTHIGEFFDPDSSDRMASLAELNDCGYSFKKLADIIENTAELL